MRHQFVVILLSWFEFKVYNQGAAHAGELAALFFVVIFAAATQVCTALVLLCYIF